MMERLSKANIPNVSPSNKTLERPISKSILKNKNFLDDMNRPRIARQSSTVTSNMKRRPEGVRSLPEPTNLSNVFGFILLSLCKKWLLIETHVKIGAYALCVIVASVIHDIAPIGKLSFMHKESWFNALFVNYGWLWASSLLLFFLYMSGLLNTGGNRKTVLFKHFTRIIVATCLWFICTTAFERLQSFVGMCADPNIKRKKICRAEGNAWIGLDISGHTFTLVYALLIISEEAKVLKNIDALRQTLAKKSKDRDGFTADSCGQQSVDKELQPLTCVSKGTAHPLSYVGRSNSANSFSLNTGSSSTLSSTASSSSLDSSERNTLNRQMNDLFQQHYGSVKLGAILLTFLMLYYEFLLLITVLYYHSMLEKILAFSIALLCWFGTYQFWFKMGIVPGYLTDGQMSIFKL